MCFEIFVVLDSNFLVYYNSRAWICSVAGFHVEARVEPVTKGCSSRGRTLKKYGKQSFVNYSKWLQPTFVTFEFL